MYSYACKDGDYEYTVTSDLPLTNPCSGKGSGTGGNTTDDNLLPSIPGGILPFGLGNILPLSVAEFLKKALWVLLIIGAIVLFLFLKSRRK